MGFSLLKFLQGPKVVDNVFDADKGLLTKVGGWIGNQQFTAEEQAEYQAQIMEGVRQFAIDTMAENTDRSKARREIAVFFIRFYSLMLFLSGVLYPFNSEWSAMWFKIATSEGVMFLVLGIGAFFFGTHMLRAKQTKEKKDG